MKIKAHFETNLITKISKVLQKVIFQEKSQVKRIVDVKSQVQVGGGKTVWERNWFDDALDVPPKMSYLSQSKPKKKKSLR